MGFLQWILFVISLVIVGNVIRGILTYFWGLSKQLNRIERTLTEMDPKAALRARTILVKGEEFHEVASAHDAWPWNER